MGQETNSRYRRSKGAPSGRLFANDLMYDVRGSRPIENAPDATWEIIKSGWYGFPDFAAGIPVTDPSFRPPGKPAPTFLLKEHPPLAPGPVITWPHRSSPMKFDFSTNPRFGFVGEDFIALFGPASGEGPGFKAVRADLDTGKVSDFLVNLKPGTEGTGPERPIEARFNPSELCLYMVDFGLLIERDGIHVPHCASGALWRVRRR